MWYATLEQNPHNQRGLIEVNPLHIFLEEVKWKRANNFGNSIGDKNTRSSEMRSKFQREQWTRVIFQKQKKAKTPDFQENSLASQLRTVGKYGASWKVELGFYNPLTEAQKEDAKKMESGR